MTMAIKVFRSGKKMFFLPFPSVTIKTLAVFVLSFAIVRILKTITNEEYNNIIS